MAERVVITGMGVVTSLGCSLEVFEKNLNLGKSGIGAIKSFSTSHLERHCGGEIKDLDARKLGVPARYCALPRSHRFAIAASLSALKDSGFSGTGDMGIALGSIVSGLEFVQGLDKYFYNYPVYAATANVCKALGLGGAAFTLSGACAAGNYALSLAYDRIRHSEAEVMLAGATDYFSLGTFVGLYRVFSMAPLLCQPFDKDRKGLIPAEGSGMLVLESLNSARRRNARIYAEVLGYGMSTDAYHPLIPLVEGVYNCMKDALEAAGVAPGDVDHISAHGTGTVPNDKTECAAIKKLFGTRQSKRMPINSIKSMLGHAMGAASSIEAISCCLTIGSGIIPPTINYHTRDPECDIDCVPNRHREYPVKTVMNNSFGFGGMNCSLLLGAYVP